MRITRIMSTPLPQPPPDRPAPSTAGAEAEDSRIKMKMILWLGIFSIAICLMVLAPRVFRGHGVKNHDQLEAINNLRQVGCMLIEFDNEYGQFPDAATASDVKAEVSTPLTFGSAYSNDLFKQCLVGGGGKSEMPFWARTAISPKKPDDRFDSDANALVKGECGFAYIAGLSSSSDPATPVAMTSLLPGTLRFDQGAFDGKALILRCDGSASAVPIEKDGRVLVNGMDIFDPKQLFWKGKRPDVKWPK